MEFYSKWGLDKMHRTDSVEPAAFLFPMKSAPVSSAAYCSEEDVHFARAIQHQDVFLPLLFSILSSLL